MLKAPLASVAAPPTIALSGRERTRTVAATIASLVSSSRIVPETLNFDCATALRLPIMHSAASIVFLMSVNENDYFSFPNTANSTTKVRKGLFE